MSPTASEQGTAYGPSTVRLPLSAAQRDIWMAHGLDTSGCRYNIGEYRELTGPLDTGLLACCWYRLACEADALRIRGVGSGDDGTPWQEVHAKPLGRSLRIVDLSDETDPVVAARAWMDTELARPFDLAHDWLTRHALIRAGRTDAGEERWFYFHAFHHLAIDGMGIALLDERLVELYDRAAAGQPWGETPFGSLGELLAEDTAYRASPEAAEDRAHWAAQLAEVEPVPRLAEGHTATVRPGALPFTRRTVLLGAERSDRLKEVARTHRAPWTMLVLALVAAYVHRVGGADTPVLGLPVTSRRTELARRTPGMMSNVIPLRVPVRADDSLTELLTTVRAQAREGLRHQRARYEDVCRDLGLGETARRIASPQVNIMAFAPGKRFFGLPTVQHNLGNGPVEDLAVGVYDLGPELGLRIDFDASPEVCDIEAVAGHQDRFVRFAERLLAEPGLALSRTEVLDTGERQRVLGEWAGEWVRHGEEPVLTARFEEQVRSGPDAVAVVFGDESLSYGELNGRANRLARRLRGLGVGRGDLAGVLLERGPDFAVALVAVVKAGAGYVLLDPEFPDERLRGTAEEADVKVLITDSTHHSRVVGGGPSVLVDRERESIAAHDRDDLDVALTGEDAACVMFTSGSTGRPKGIVSSHRNLVSTVTAQSYAVFGAGEVFLQCSPVSWDAFSLEFWGALLHGGATVLQPGQRPEPALVAELAVRHRVTMLQLSSSLFNYLVDEHPGAFATVRIVFTGGEPASPTHIARLHRLHPRVTVTNGYGPAESMGFSTTHTVDRAGVSGASVPIGRPVANKFAYVLDEGLRPVPPGVTGELYLAGEGVAHGYLAQPAVTAARFVPNPFGPVGSRCYRTGDRAYWDGDGRLHYAGRSDGQVKIRGFRIEPTEIETVLTGHPGITQAVLLATDHLTAYVTAAPGASVTPAGLRAWLRERLPEHMVPAHVVLLDRLPLTPNGKIDKRALPQVEAPLASYGRAPRTELEELVRDMTSEVLGSAAPLSIDDSFFDHGGHSLLAARLTHRIATTFGVTLTLRDVFQHPTPAALARRITEATGRPALPALTRADVRPDRLPLSYAQQRLWLVAGLNGPDTAYNVPMAVRLSGGEVDAAALRAAVGDLVRRHAPLRTRFATAEGQPYQVVTPADDAAAGVCVEVREVTPDEAETELQAAARHAFDLATEHPLRVTLLREGDGRATLLVLLHHIATDGQSLRPLFADLSAAYTARAAGRAPDWEPLPLDYADYALWQRTALDGRLDEQVTYWCTALADLPEEPALVTDRPRPAVAGRRGDAIRVDFGRDLHKRVLELARAERCTPFMVLQAALAATLTRLGAGTDIPLGSPVAGRPDEALTELVGFFVNTLVLRTDTSGDPEFRDLLARVRTTDLDAFTHQDAPFDLVLEAVNPARSLARHPLFQICLTLESGPPALPDLPGIQAAPAQPPATGSVKFDLEFLLTADDSTGLSGTVLYSSDLYDRSTVERMVEALRRLLEHAVSAPGTALSQLEILDTAERRRVLGEWAGEWVRYGEEPVLTARFEERVRSGPDAVAVVFGDESLSYGELNGRANRLARRLRGLGVGRGDLAGVLLERGPDFAVALVAVVKAGAGYVLLDPEFPDERLRGTAEEADVKVLITDTGRQRRGIDGPWSEVLVDEEGAVLAAQDGEDLSLVLTGEDAACVMFTSGSTGRPKGIVSSHRNLVSTVTAQSYAVFGAGEVFLQCSPVSWDAFSLEFWGALLHGGATVLQPGQRPEPALVAELAVRHRVTMLQLSSSLFNYLVDEHPGAFATVRIVFTGGEPASPTHIARLHRLHPRVTVTNGYGPAESMGFSTTHTVDRAGVSGASVPIGRPVANKFAYVLDEGLRPVPPGVTGELYLAGEGVAHGYLAQPAVTAARFVPNPFGPVGSRCYRTGDRAYWDGDGRLHYAGRSDGQVKIRGFRIEPTEIETVLTGHPGITQAVLLATDHLTAYVVPTTAPGPEPQEVRRWLRERLPDHMVPAFVMALDRLPLTPNGKIDKRALPAAPAPRTTRDGRGPRTPLESTVLGLFTEVLPVTQTLTIDDSFFDHGGHSLLAARLSHRIATALGVTLTLRDVFQHPTPAALAEHIESGPATAAAPKRVRPTLRRRTDDQ
ncbi:amino acid adenylation domain-containing protein [Streptomyces djakartensis]|uniref:amino acid adenylation domain-containing protein n=1 Tax=Streptomyces djakartensis TaxID=68193 RepID=UPI0034DF7A32